MSGKRQASYTIDPITLEEKERNAENQPEAAVIGTAAPIQERKFFKIRRPGYSQPSIQKESKISFKLNESQEIKSQAEDKKAEELADDKDQKLNANPFSTSLFGGSSNLFNGIGIFSNLKSTNLFTSNKGTEETSKLSTPSANGNSIFSGKGPSIFDNSIKNTASSLFTQKTANNNDDDGSGDSAELQQAQKFENNPQKSNAVYQYDNSCPILLTVRASKFKKGSGQLVQNVQIVLQKQKQTNVKYITVRLPATKKQIFSGILVEGRSEFKHLHGKKQNLQVGAFYKEKYTLAKVLLKFQFQNPEDGQKLFERLEQLLRSAKTQHAKNQSKVE